MTDSTVLATFSDVKFIEGVTKLTQANWQQYFSASIPNGIYSGLEPRAYIGNTSFSNGRRVISDGEVIVNGIYAKLETREGYTDIGIVPTTARDRFICVRISFEEETVQLIAKYDIAPEEINDGQHDPLYNDQNKLYNLVASYFISDESYQCERNSSYWELPVLYQSRPIIDGHTYETTYGEGLDLRRHVYKYTEKKENNPYPGFLPSSVDANKHFLSGHNNIGIELSGTHYVYIDPVNPPDDALIYSYNSCDIYFCTACDINNVLLGKADESDTHYSSVTSVHTLYEIETHGVSGTDSTKGLYKIVQGSIFRINHVHDRFYDLNITNPPVSYLHKLAEQYILIEKLK